MCQRAITLSTNAANGSTTPITVPKSKGLPERNATQPPMMTMAKAFTITLVPAKGVSTRMGPSMAPPMPASAEAITKVSMMS